MSDNFSGILSIKSTVFVSNCSSKDTLSRKQTVDGLMAQLAGSFLSYRNLSLCSLWRPEGDVGPVQSGNICDHADLWSVGWLGAAARALRKHLLSICCRRLRSLTSAY